MAERTSRRQVQTPSGQAVEATRAPNIATDPVAQKPILSPRQLIWRRFLRHRLGVIGSVVVIIMMLITIFAGFLSPYAPGQFHQQLGYAPPTPVRFVHEGQFIGPFVHGTTRTFDPNTGAAIFRQTDEIYPIKFFVLGDSYRLLGLFDTNVHLFGTGEPPRSPGQVFLFGADQFGRDLLTRTLIGGRVSLFIGPLALLIILPLAAFFGGISGYFGGWADMAIQRVIELLQSYPQLPLLLVLATILPPDLSQEARFMGIILILSITSWTGIARVLRGQILAYREEEYVLAARGMGAGNNRIIFRHLLPNTLSYLIVVATLTIPGLILAEAGLSFLGLGINEPATSWGLLLREANSVSSLTNHPWLLMPGFFIIVSVLAFNFMGDALRDATDPKSGS